MFAAVWSQTMATFAVIF